MARKSLPQLAGHIGFIFHNNVVVHGGVNENNEVENRWHSINLLSETCEEVTVDGEIRGLHQHGCVASAGTGPAVRRRFHEKLYGSLVMTSGPDVADKAAGDGHGEGHEGVKYSALTNQTPGNGLMLIRDRDRDASNEFWVYIFGGLTAAMEPTNDFWKVEANQGSLKVGKAAYHGIPPSPRYGHGMCHLSYLRALTVSGGVGQVYGEEVFFNDLHLFFLANTTWVRVKTDSKIEGRAFMGVGEYGSGGLMVFGGMSSRNFIDAGLQIFRLTDRIHAYLANYPCDSSGTDIFLKTFGEEPTHEDR